MTWLHKLFTEHSIEQAILACALVISAGILLGKIKVWGISLGVSWILFVGLFASYCGLTIDRQIQYFLRDFGLILFVYSIGLQLGPGFFASLKRNAIVNNLLAAAVVAAGVALTVVMLYVSGSSASVMAGLMSGAVTNTPGLGAAKAAITDLNIASDPSLVTLAYAVTYPFGVFGIILALLILKKVCGVNILHEEKLHQRLSRMQAGQIVSFHLNLENRRLNGQPLRNLNMMLPEPVVVTRILRNDEVFTPVANTRLMVGDVLLVVTPRGQRRTLETVIGSESDIDPKTAPHSELTDSVVVVTQAEVTHRSLGDIPELKQTDFTMARIMRAGIELIPAPHVTLQLGDTVKVVGTRVGVDRVTRILGNSIKKLDIPNLAPIFLGIVLGVLLGSVPIFIPGVPVPMKIGLAGGPLIVALVLSRYGGKFYLNNYTTYSGNLMMRELGITLFLAAIGLGSGHNLAAAFAGGQGWSWIGMGAVITLVPLLVVGFIAMRCFRKTYSELCGLLAGATTDPPALAFALKITNSDVPSTTYATVYPLAMILRIVAAQLVVLFF